MKTIQTTSRILCLLIVSILFSVCPDLSAQPQTASPAQIVILAADSWYPFNGDPKADKPGYMVEVARRILEPKGFKVDYQIMPWARAVSEMEATRIDGIIGATPEETENAIFPAESLGTSSDSFFVRADSTWRYTGPDSLRAVTLGGISGYGYSNEIQRYIDRNSANSKLIQLESGDTSLEQNIKKLQAKRIDALIESPVVFWNRISELGLEKELFIEAGSDNSQDPLYIAFSAKKHNSKKLAGLLDAGIVEIRKSGELKQILSRYGLEDWK